jgi:hypothetical protein
VACWELLAADASTRGQIRSRQQKTTGEAVPVADAGTSTLGSSVELGYANRHSAEGTAIRGPTTVPVVVFAMPATLSCRTRSDSVRFNLSARRYYYRRTRTGQEGSANAFQRTRFR